MKTLPINDIYKNEVWDPRKFVDNPADIFFGAEEGRDNTSLSVLRN